MLSAIWVLTLLGLDGFAVSLGLGPLVRGHQRYAIASAFGLCDGVAILLAPLLSLSFAGAISSFEERALPVLVIAYAMYAVVLAGNARAIARGWQGWFALPLATSLDNLAAGPLASGTVSIEVVACLAAFISAAMSLAALALGAMLQRNISMEPVRVAAAGFLLAAAFLIA